MQKNFIIEYPMKLVTHDGSFHYDEVLATAVLLEIYPDAEVIRTRVDEIIKTGDIVYDVGGEFDPSKNRFDHHQKSFQDTFSPRYEIRMSSAGLIYKYYCDKLFEKYGFSKSSGIYEDIREKIYAEFFLPADAIDNGYDIFGELKPRTVADVVRSFNVYSTSNESVKEESKRFRNALRFVSLDLRNYLNSVLMDYVVNYEALYEELSGFEGDVFVTSKKLTTDLVYDIDQKLNKDIKFVVVKNDKEARILTMPVEKGKFGIKYPLHPKWRGLAGDDLVKASGIPGCVFVHATGFTGGNKTVEGAIEMCRKTLEYLNRNAANKQL